ncbi:glycoside hydrolase family 31 protein [Xylariaceae sp. FL0016]|nr:glycoside hydrolase family 31 protein [Xylariaceae sp. FL0016]
MFSSPEPTVLEYTFDSERLRVEAWGPNALRVRATPETSFPSENWALTEALPPIKDSDVRVTVSPEAATLRNGNITASVTAAGKLVLTETRSGRTLLEEYTRSRDDVLDPKASALRIVAREFRPRLGAASYHLTARFEASHHPGERLYGMGQYQQPGLDLAGCDLELAQRNSQASVPFALSSAGYGLLWNNPAVGRAVFGANRKTFEAYSTAALDYWVVAGDTPRDIVRAYGAVVGRPPAMPEYGLGFWQCKLRYQTQDEILEVARKHKRELGLPMDVIVVDYFHWPYEGEWKFDETFWPDPDAMIAELKSMDIELMVSIWPTVDRRSENWAEMLEKGLLMRQDRGWRIAMEGEGNCVHFDATNPAARQYVWQKAKQHYFDKGVRIFWLDEAEPEFTHYDFDNYRYHAGPDLMVGNIYPLQYSRAFYEGQKAVGQDNIVNLVRCCWAGSQKYGALLWSGDIASSWPSFRAQVSAGLNAGLAGIAWWTTDIGGFHGGDPRDPAFRELFTRWFQFSTFSPVLRSHGDREPKQPRKGHTGGSHVRSGAPNEVWSYGPQTQAVLASYLRLRDDVLRPYVRGLMAQAHEHGDPVIRPMFYEFPAEKRMWELQDQFMFGDRYLVAPVLCPGQTRRTVVLPANARWQLFTASGVATGEMIEGGREIVVDAPIEYMPVFQRL